jgi:hypothetical protein
MKPYHKFIFTLLLILPSALCEAQNIADTAQVNFIKTQYTEINNNLKSYRKVVKTDTVETTEGNEIRLYFSGDEIKKIEALYYGETGKALTEYYFFNKKLMFCYLAEYKYDVSINASNGKVKIISTKEKRYYFKNGIIFLVKLKPSISTKADMNNLTISTRKESQRLMNL